MVNKISIDFDKAVRNQLARSLEQGKYIMLIDRVHSSVDISVDKEFQTAFDVRLLNVGQFMESFRKKTFKPVEAVIQNKGSSYRTKDIRSLLEV